MRVRFVWLLVAVFRTFHSEGTDVRALAVAQRHRTQFSSAEDFAKEFEEWISNSVKG